MIAGPLISARREERACCLRWLLPSQLLTAMQREETITPAAEWLVANFYIVDLAAPGNSDGLAARFYRRFAQALPQPSTGDPRGFFGVAWAFFRLHTDRKPIRSEVLRHFVRAYQRVCQTTYDRRTLGCSSSRSCVLIGNLRRLAEHLVRSRARAKKLTFVADSLSGPAVNP